MTMDNLSRQQLAQFSWRRGLSISVSHRGRCYRLQLGLLGQERWYCDDQLLAVKRLNWCRNSEVQHDGVRLRLETISLLKGHMRLQVLEDAQVVAEQVVVLDDHEAESEHESRPPWPLRYSPAIVSVATIVLLLVFVESPLNALLLIPASAATPLLAIWLHQRGVDPSLLGILPGYLTGYAVTARITSGESFWFWIAMAGGLSLLVLLTVILKNRSVKARSVQGCPPGSVESLKK